MSFAGGALLGVRARGRGRSTIGTAEPSFKRACTASIASSSVIADAPTPAFASNLKPPKPAYSCTRDIFVALSCAAVAAAVAVAGNIENGVDVPSSTIFSFFFTNVYCNCGCGRRAAAIAALHEMFFSRVCARVRSWTTVSYFVYTILNQCSLMELPPSHTSSFRSKKKFLSVVNIASPLAVEENSQS